MYYENSRIVSPHPLLRATNMWIYVCHAFRASYTPTPSYLLHPNAGYSPLQATGSYIQPISAAYSPALGSSYSAGLTPVVNAPPATYSPVTKGAGYSSAVLTASYTPPPSYSPVLPPATYQPTGSYRF